MNALSFSFEGTQVRTVGTLEVPLFVALDVCNALGYKNSHDALSKHVAPEDLIKAEIETTGGIQTVNCVTESGMYALIFGSKLESAKRFKHWVTTEVLPAIRKTGSYSTTPATIGFDPATLLQKALTGEINVRETASTLASAAALLQVTETLKNISPDVRVEKIMQASQAFELVLNGQASLNAADEAFKRQRISERNRANALSGWRKRKETMNTCQEKEVQ